jgi:hypothetical protein
MQPQCPSQVGQLSFKTFNRRTFPEGRGCIFSPWVAISQPQCQSQVGQPSFKTFNRRTLPGGCICSPWVAISQPQCPSQEGQLSFKACNKRMFPEAVFRPHGWQIGNFTASVSVTGGPALRPLTGGRSPRMTAVFRPHGWLFHSLSVSHRWAICPSKPSIGGRSPRL